MYESFDNLCTNFGMIFLCDLWSTELFSLDSISGITIVPHRGYNDEGTENTRTLV